MLRPIVFGAIWKVQAFWRRYTWVFSRDHDRFLRSGRGVIHVGANAGQERDLYEKLGLRVIWAEPDPRVFKELQHNIRNHPRQRAFQALVTDRDDTEYDFHIANNAGFSSSIFDLKLHRDIWPEIEYQDSMRIKGTTLDTLLRDAGIPSAGFDCLVLDTQGSELLVLQGARELLPKLRFIKTEVADFEAYAGCCQLPELEAFLKERGFVEYSRRVEYIRPQGGTYFDIIYRNSARRA